MTVGDRNPEGFSSNVGFATVLDWREGSRTIESFAMMRSWLPTLVTNGEAERLPAVRVSWNYFDMMGVRPALGRPFTIDDDRPDHWRVLLLSDALWRHRFGADPSVVGRIVVMNDREYRIVGVMPASFEPLDAQRYYNADAEIWAPIGYDLNGDSSCRGCRHLRGFGRLKRGVTVADATAEMNTILDQMRRDADLALALVLLAGAGLMLRTVVALTHADPGFHADRILSLQFSLVGRAYAEDPAVIVFQNRALEKLRAIPGVEGAALAGQIPFGGNADCWGFHVNGRMKPNPVDDPCVERYGISPDYLRVMGVPVLNGRAFTDADTAAGQAVIVISQSTAKTVWGDENPIGSQVRIGGHTRGPWRTIIGVVADVHHDDLTEPLAPAMYTPQTQITDSYLTAVVKATTRDAAVLAAPVRGVLRELDPTVPVYDVATLSSLIEKSGAQRLFVMRLLAGFAIVSVLLAAIGLYGVVSHGVAQRTREVGVRVALGAQRGDVLRLVLSSGLSLVALGVAGGLAAAFAATRFLGTLMFGVSPVDPPTFAAAAALLILIALLAHWVPIRRALRNEPASAMRAD